MEQKGTTQVQVRRQAFQAPAHADLYLQRQCACGQHTIAGGECEVCSKNHDSLGQRAGVVPLSPSLLPSSTPEPAQTGFPELPAADSWSAESSFAHDFSQVPIQAASPASGLAASERASAAPFVPSPLSAAGRAPALQAKYEATQPTDVYEREADEVAERAAQPEQQPDSTALVEKTPLPQPSPSSNGILNVLKQGPAMPLSGAVRRRVEPLFGVDLSSVRVHTGSTASEATSILHAKAFTSQEHIWLGARQSPESVELMAHEATHVVQQATSPASQGAIQRKLQDDEQVEDGEVVRNRMQQRIRDAVQQSPHPEAATMDSDADMATSQNAVGVTSAEARQAAGSVDRRALAEKRRELEPDAMPPVDRQAEVRPQVEQATQEVKEKSEEPPKTLPQQGIVPPTAKEPAAGQQTGGEQDVVGDAEVASGLAEAAAAGPDSSMAPALPGFGAVPTIPTPPSGTAPSLDITPVNAKGEQLPTDPALDAQVADLAQQAQTLREQGQLIRNRAAQEMGNAQTLRGNINLIQKNIGQAERGVQTSLGHLEFRRGALDKARQALSVSQQKAAMVTKEAPTYSAKADEGQQRTGPMARDAAKLTADNKAKTPDDPDAADKSHEQGDKLNKVGSDTATVNDAITQTKERAGTLSQDAAKATQVNTATSTKIETMQETLQQSGQRLSQMQQQNAQAHSEVEGVKSQPGEMHAQAIALDAQGASLIQAAADIEQQLQQSQAQYTQDLQAIPVVPETEAAVGLEGQQAPLEVAGSPESPTELASPTTPEKGNISEAQTSAPAGEEKGSQEQTASSAPSPTSSQPPVEPPPASEATTPQGQPAITPQAPGKGGYEQRIHINVAEGLPSWLTGEGADTEEEKSQAELDHQKAQLEKSQQREADLKLINDKASGNFSSLSATDKALIALHLTGRKLFGSIGKIEWPGWGKVGKFAKGLGKGLIDPRGPLMGVLSGFSMIVSAEANLLSKEQWQRDPLGNLLKSAADIATGLTIIFGSITALALLIITIMTALTIITFGFAAPGTGPVIAFCATIVSVVGGWTIYTGAIALLLQALVLIKNLYDAATAQTAEQLEAKSDDMKEDVSNAGNVLLQMGTAKLAQLGGNKLLSEIEEAGGGVAYASKLPGRFVQGAKALPGRIARGAKALPGRIVRGAKALPGRIVGGAERGLGRIKGLVSSLGREGEAEAGALATRGATKLGTEAEQIASLGKMTPETEAMLENNPSLREALAENPKAADALKLCASYCFPENATPAQIKRLNDMLERVEKASIKVDMSDVREFLHSNRANLDEAIGTLEKKFGSELAAPTSKTPFAEEPIKPPTVESGEGPPRERYYYGGGEAGSEGMRTLPPSPIAEKAPRLKVPAEVAEEELSKAGQVEEEFKAAGKKGDPLHEISESKELSIGKPVETPSGELEAPSRTGPMEAGNEFNRIQRAKYPYNEVPIRTRSGGLVWLDSYNPETGEIVSRKFTQLAEVDYFEELDNLQELRVQYPPDAVIADVPKAQTMGLAGQKLQGSLILEVPVQRNPVPQGLLDYARSRGITIRDVKGFEYH